VPGENARALRARAPPRHRLAPISRPSVGHSAGTTPRPFVNRPDNGVGQSVTSLRYQATPAPASLEQASDRISQTRPRRDRQARRESCALMPGTNAPMTASAWPGRKGGRGRLNNRPSRAREDRRAIKRGV